MYQPPSCYYHCRFRTSCPTVRDALDWDRPGVGQAVLYMFLESIVLFVVIILIEVRIAFRITTP